MKPSVGRIVSFYPQESDLDSRGNGIEVGQPIPAVITRVWSDTVVNLRVLADSSGSLPWRTSVTLRTNPDHVFSWAWPERV